MNTKQLQNSSLINSIIASYVSSSGHDRCWKRDRERKKKTSNAAIEIILRFYFALLVWDDRKEVTSDVNVFCLTSNVMWIWSWMQLEKKKEFLYIDKNFCKRRGTSQSKLNLVAVDNQIVFITGDTWWRQWHVPQKWCNLCVIWLLNNERIAFSTHFTFYGTHLKLKYAKFPSIKMCHIDNLFSCLKCVLELSGNCEEN